MKAEDTKVGKLLVECEEKIKWYDWKFISYSYRSAFKEIRKTFFTIIKDEDIELDEDELKAFIDICNNRLDQAKSFLAHTATSLSILIGSMVVLVAILIGVSIKAEFYAHPLLDTLKQFGFTSWIFAALVLGITVFLVLLVGHYRTEVHAWYVIKEGVLLRKAREEGKGKNK